METETYIIEVGDECCCKELGCATAWVHCMCCGNDSFTYGTWSDFALCEMTCPECGEILFCESCTPYVYPDGTYDSGSFFSDIYEGMIYYRGHDTYSNAYGIWDDMLYAKYSSDSDTLTDQCGNTYVREEL